MPSKGSLCRTLEKKKKGKISLRVFRFSNTGSYLFWEQKSWCHVWAMKQKHAMLSRSTLDDASHYLPCLALALSASPKCSGCPWSSTMVPCRQQHLGQTMHSEHLHIPGQHHCLCLITTYFLANLHWPCRHQPGWNPSEVVPELPGKLGWHCMLGTASIV